jgi:hypothetical protein
MAIHVQESPFSGSDLTGNVNLTDAEGWAYSVRTIAAGTSAITLEVSTDNSNWSIEQGFHDIAYDLVTGQQYVPYARFIRNSAATVTAHISKYIHQ